MLSGNAGLGFIALFTVLLVLTSVFYAKAGLDAKRRWHPWIVVTGTVVFLAFIWMRYPIGLLKALACLGVLAMAALTLRFSTFCPSCGLLIYRYLARESRTCPGCGAEV